MRNCTQAGKLFDGLMRRAVLTKCNAVVREHVDHMQSHQRGEAHRRPHVIRKDQERRAERHDSTVRCQAIHDRSHGMLAHAEVQVAAGVAPAAAVGALSIAGAHAGRLEVPQSLQRGVGRWIEIRRTADQRRQTGRDRVHHLARGDPGGHAFGVGRKDGNVFSPAGGQSAAGDVKQFLGEVGKRSCICGEPALPLGFVPLASCNGFAKMSTRGLGDVKRRLGRPAEVLLGQAHFFFAQRRTVRFVSVLLVG